MQKPNWCHNTTFHAPCGNCLFHPTLPEMGKGDLFPTTFVETFFSVSRILSLIRIKIATIALLRVSRSCCDRWSEGELFWRENFGVAPRFEVRLVRECCAEFWSPALHVGQFSPWECRVLCDVLREMLDSVVVISVVLLSPVRICHQLALIFSRRIRCCNLCLQGCATKDVVVAK